MFQGKKILLAITGSIAAYKSILIVRLLIKAGAEVRVILTPSAKRLRYPTHPFNPFKASCHFRAFHRRSLEQPA